MQVISENLADDKKWYVLNTSLCGIPPRKFCQNELFNLFKDEVRCLPARELQVHVQNGGQTVSLKRHPDVNVYVGSTFALIAGNIRRRIISDSVLLNTGVFCKIRDWINKQSLDEVSDLNSSSESSSSRSSTSSHATTSDSSFESDDHLVSTPKFEDKKWKISTTTRKRKLAPNIPPPIFTSSPSTPTYVSSSPSSSSFEDIEDSNYDPLYKKRKIRHKATSLISQINDICHENNEELSNIIARCCLLERRDTAKTGKSNEMMQDIFLKVEKELGIHEAFEKTYS